jgi:hypothetical protein
MIFKYLLLSFFLASPFSPDPVNLIFFPKSTNTTLAKTIDKKVASTEILVDELYSNLHKNQFSLPKLESFAQALNGFYKLKEEGKIKKDIVTLIDFSLPSSAKRLWVIDLVSKTILFQSLVAHGRNTGEEFADSFSNAAQSFKSSLGFYSTGEVYNGKHGLSLRLDGLEKGINDNARNRGVVIHAANYVSASFIKNNKRLGRSEGCPALPVSLSKEIISAIKDKSCLFIYHPKLS